jgi:hypothetical protein
MDITPVGNVFFMQAEDVIAMFNKWQEKFELAPSVGAYERIISFCCSLSKVMAKVSQSSIVI